MKINMSIIAILAGLVTIINCFVIAHNSPCEI